MSQFNQSSVVKEVLFEQEKTKTANDMTIHEYRLLSHTFTSEGHPKMKGVPEHCMLQLIAGRTQSGGKRAPKHGIRAARS